MYIRERKYMQDSIVVANMYEKIAKEDEKAAQVLIEQGLYNQAAYFLIQAMEKQIKSKIASKVNITNEYFAEEINKTMGHSLDRSIQFLIQIYTGNNQILQNQMKYQLPQLILKGINFRNLHNSVRYPIYKKPENYTFIHVTKKECLEMVTMLSRLKGYLNELDKK